MEPNIAQSFWDKFDPLGRGCGVNNWGWKIWYKWVNLGIYTKNRIKLIILVILLQFSISEKINVIGEIKPLAESASELAENIEIKNLCRRWSYKKNLFIKLYNFFIKNACICLLKIHMPLKTKFAVTDILV